MDRDTVHHFQYVVSNSFLWSGPVQSGGLFPLTTKKQVFKFLLHPVQNHWGETLRVTVVGSDLILNTQIIFFVTCCQIAGNPQPWERKRGESGLQNKLQK